ncbi:unnamed protein product [Porites evermanni]|uniref:THO complex 6 n=1 Tax=Porites evermanni TaxID=104178 RepID=A0ABN8RCE2_9CNID|nr:unnamed protein product [Porites evermanni]
MWDLDSGTCKVIQVLFQMKYLLATWDSITVVYMYLCQFLAISKPMLFLKLCQDVPFIGISSFCLVCLLFDNLLNNTLTGHRDYIQCLCLRTKHSQCVSGAEDGTVRLWDYRTKGTLTGLIEPCKNEDIHRPQLGSWIGCVSVDESQDWLVCGGGPSLSVWHLRSMACTAVLRTESCQQTALFHNDLILSAGSEPHVFHWQINGDPKTHVPCTPKSVFALQVNDKSPKNKVLAVGGSSADIDVFTNFGYRALSLKFCQ